jgi:transcriptional repressor NrdR
VKTSGQREPFDRAKIIAGVTAACKGRPVTAEQIDQLGEGIEEHARLSGPEVASTEIGLEVLNRLRSLDEVAYLRFASVYKGFDAAADFQRELVLLKKLQRS